MKNFGKFFGIAALVAVMVLSMAGCPTDDDDNNSSSGFIGAELKIENQQVYRMEMDEETYSISYPTFNGNLALDTSYSGGAGSVSNGKLNFTIGTPPAGKLETLDFESLYGEDEYDERPSYTNIISTKPNVKGLYIWGLDVTSNTYSGLRKSNMTSSINEKTMTISVTYEVVMYIYVNEDVTVSGKGTTYTYTDDWGDTITDKTNNFKLEFKEGWNALYAKMASTQKYANDDSVTETNTETMSLSNPNLKWVLGEDDYERPDYSMSTPKMQRK